MNKYQKLLGETLEVQSKSGNEKRMKKFVKEYLTGIGLKPFGDKFGNIYCHKGDKSKGRPFVVAHLDTVHKVDKNVKTFFNGSFFYAFDMVQMSQRGVGGDDKVGIWAALAAITEFDDISIALFVQEEVGCKGSRNANMDNLKKANWLVQLDRKGSLDFITANMASDDFISDMTPIAESYGMANTTQSTITDVSALYQRSVGVSAVNISSGYYWPHSDAEVVNWEDAYASLSLMYEMIGNHGHKKYPHALPKKRKTNKTGFRGTQNKTGGTIVLPETTLEAATSAAKVIHIDRAAYYKEAKFVRNQMRLWNAVYGCFEWRDLMGNLICFEGTGTKAQYFSKSYKNLRTKDKNPPPYQDAIPFGGTFSSDYEIKRQEPKESQEELDFFDDKYMTDDEYFDRMAKDSRLYEEERAEELSGVLDNDPVKTYHDYGTGSEDLHLAELSSARAQLDGVLFMYGSNMQEFLDGRIPDEIIKNISATLHYDHGNTVAYYERMFGIQGSYDSADHSGSYTSFDRNLENVPF